MFRGTEMCSGDQNKINVFWGREVVGKREVFRGSEEEKRVSEMRSFGEERSVSGIRIR